MSKKTITLTLSQWQAAYHAVSRGAAAREVEEQLVQHRLCQLLKTSLTNAEGPTLAIIMASPERRMLDAMVANPGTPWTVQALESVVWPIRQALGWTPPDYDDDEEADEDADITPEQ